MPSFARHRVVSPILTTNKARGFLTLPVGSIIEVSDSLDEPGLHSVRFGAEELFAFTRDIEERTEQIDPSAEFGEVVARKESSKASAG
jgi:hypothetical protein